ncbi:TetR family transcriptional regulator [Micromonospora phytophila]|uniref:TetR/AcrR family transcriptional regulator n=1 Tax=Micromonospora phytophila TaxID=709888 RepID=UPI00202FE11F|nr:TetR family transcriptional regulator [Micromonospora phytophila]MCM0673313.1 TetR family transcriptional regulator [Micromonospora phytophila]
MARPKNQEERRHHLVQAARRAIVAHGLGSVRVRDIADAAGMATGSVTYYFREVEQLFQEVYAEAIDRFDARRTAAADSVNDPRERLLVTIRSGLPTGPDDELCCLLYEFSPQARRRRVDAALRRTLYDRQVSLYRSILDTGAGLGHFQLTAPSTQIASNLVALEDAYGYHVIARTSITRDRAEANIIGYASTATGCDLTAATRV